MSDILEMRKALEAVLQYENSNFFGLDGEGNRRKAWRGVIRKVKKALGKINDGRDEE